MKREYFMAAGVLFIFGALFHATIKDVRAARRKRKESEASWMAECLSERKHYECVSMWRAGEKSENSTYIFIPH